MDEDVFKGGVEAAVEKQKDDPNGVETQLESNERP